MANLLSRFRRFLTGKAEAKRPITVYQQAIEDQTKAYQRLAEAASGLEKNFDRLDAELEKAQSKLRETQARLAQARRDFQSADKKRSEEAVVRGSMLIEDEEKLINRIEQMTENRAVMEERVKDAQGKLAEFRGRIEALKEESRQVDSQVKPSGGNNG